MLRVKNLSVNYGNVQALKSINLEVKQGEIVTILGANGAGKTTTLLAISGLLKPKTGQILYKDQEVQDIATHQRIKLGIAHVPEGRRVFATLTVEENLHLGSFTLKDKKQIKQNLEMVYALFPRLQERRKQLAGTLSGGEQQMLAIARGLMANPKLLLLDEPSLGLAPLLVKSIFATIKEINQQGVTILLVEQNARAALKLAHRGYVLEVGKIVLTDTAKNLLTNPQVSKAYLGG